MAGDTGGDVTAGAGGLTQRLRTLGWGRDDPRVRATYRVLLAMPVFWILAGGVFVGNLRAVIDLIPSGDEPLAGLAGSLLHGGFVLVLLVGWARYLDRRPLSEYGVSASRSWLADLLAGLGAIFGAFALWFGVATALGWASVGVAMSAPQWPLLVGIGLFVITLGIHVWIQQVVFFRIIIKNAAEGLHSRSVSPRRAVLMGVLVTIPIFVVMHQLTINLRVLDLAVTGIIYGLLYVHTRELALGIGLHLGIFLSDQVLFVSASNVADSVSILQVTTSLPEAIEILSAYGFPKNIVAYALVLGYLLWRHGEVPIETKIARVNDQ